MNFKNWNWQQDDWPHSFLKAVECYLTIGAYRKKLVNLLLCVYCGKCLQEQSVQECDKVECACK